MIPIVSPYKYSCANIQTGKTGKRIDMSENHPASQGESLGTSNDLSKARTEPFGARVWLLAACIAALVGLGSWIAFRAGVSPVLVHASEVAVVVALAFVAIWAARRERGNSGAAQAGGPQVGGPQAGTLQEAPLRAGGQQAEGLQAEGLGPLHAHLGSCAPASLGSSNASQGYGTMQNPPLGTNLGTSTSASLGMQVNGEGASPASSSPSPLQLKCYEIAAVFDLSSRERDVLVLLAQGMSRREIEETLVISMNTVKSHIRRIYQKLNIHSRDELEKLLNQ